jgi:hypothetical protein
LERQIAIEREMMFYVKEGAAHAGQDARHA